MLFGDVADVDLAPVGVGDCVSEQIFDEIDSEGRMEYAAVGDFRVGGFGRVHLVVNGQVVFGLAAPTFDGGTGMNEWLGQGAIPPLRFLR